MRMFTSRLLAYTLILALPLWLGSCKKDTDTVTPSSIEGSWRISGLKINPGVDLFGTGKKDTDLLAVYRSFPGGSGNDAVECLTTSVITFVSGGKVTGKNGSKCDPANDINPVDTNSSWKLDGTKLTLTSGADVTVYDTALSGNTLQLSVTDMEDFGEGTKSYTQTLELTRQ